MTKHMHSKLRDTTNLREELITNGGLVGNANGWTLDANWAYNSNSTYKFDKVGRIKLQA
jgi:hypothetical protein